MREYCEGIDGVFNGTANKLCLDQYSCAKNGEYPSELTPCCSKYSDYERPGLNNDGTVPRRICKEKPPPPPPKPDEKCCYIYGVSEMTTWSM